MDSDKTSPAVPGAEVIAWDVADPAGRPIEFMRQMRDDMEGRVRKLIDEIT